MAKETQNKYIEVMYKLYTSVPDRLHELEEETAEDDPFIFVSGLGMTLDAFEEKIVPLKAGDRFDFTLTPDEAYGEYEETGRQILPKRVFEIDGKIDPRFIYKGAVVPLNSADGARFNGIITNINDESITVDLNHPLAGKSLIFVGYVVETREATGEEISEALNQITGCGGGCSGCSGCGSGNCGSCGG